ncbi:hypothetical protein D4764_0068310, partial [Takifugu flavidus]
DQEDTDEDDQEDTDEDDHEDIEAIVKEMLALRTQSSGVTCQAPPGGPPLGTGLLSPPPPSQAPTAELKPADCFPVSSAYFECCAQILLRAAASYDAAVMLPVFSRVTVLIKGRGDADATKTRTGVKDQGQGAGTKRDLVTGDVFSLTGGVAMIRPSVPKREEKRLLKTSLASEG